MVASVLLMTFLSISWLGIGLLVAGLELLPWGLALGCYHIASAAIILVCLVSAFIGVRHDWVDLEKDFRGRRAWLLNGCVVLLIEGLVTVLLYLPSTSPSLSTAS